MSSLVMAKERPGGRPLDDEIAARLRASEDRYRTLFDTMDEGFCVVEWVERGAGRPPDLVFREVNRAFAVQTGLHIDVVGRAAQELLPNYAMSWVDIFTRVDATGLPERTDHFCVDLGRWYRAHYSRIGGPGSRLFAVVFEDVSDRKDAELALQESETRSRQLLEGVAQAFWEADAEGAVAADSPSWRAYTGQTLKQFRGDGWLKAIHPDDRDRAERDWREAVSASRMIDAEVRLRAPGGGYRWTNIRANPLLDEDGRVTKWVAMNIDIEERKRVEQALRDSEQRLRTLVDTLPVGVGLIDLEGRLVLSNQEMQRYLPSGLIPSRDANHHARWLARRPDGGLVDKQDFPGARALRGERVVPGMDMLYTPESGDPTWVRVAAVPASDADGRLTGQFAVIMDIDHLKRSQERQEVLLAELQHRVRNILGMVRSIARRTAEGAESAEELHHHLEGRIDALARTQVLLTRRAGAGVDLASLVYEEMLAQIADQARLEVEGPAVTLAPKAAEVLTLAIHELATNSIKYGALREDRGRLSIRWEQFKENQEDWLRLEWIEGGVRVASTAPRRVGFGTDLVTRRVPYELNGRGALEIRPGGVVCRVEFPLAAGDSILDRLEPHN